MAKIIVNNTVPVNGHLSVRRELKTDEENNSEYFVITGVLQTHTYFEEIRELEIPRLKVKGIRVYAEDYGSDDYNILYYFTALDLIMNGIYSKKNETYNILSTEEMKAIEDIMYKNDVPFLGDIGEQYQKCIKVKKEE